MSDHLLNGNQPPQYALDIKKLRLELTRAVAGDADWADFDNDYLRDLIEIRGLSHDDANEMRKGFQFRFSKDGTERCVSLIQEDRGLELLLSWDIGLL